jgi:nuclear pore complex protein Nup205
MDSLERLQGLHADLVAFTETRLPNIDRLWQELEESIQDFKNLLDKSAPASSDRDAYNQGGLPRFYACEMDANL